MVKAVNRRTHKLCTFCVATVTASTVISSCPAQAGMPVPMPPMMAAVDANGVDLLTGLGSFSLPQISIGSGDALLQRTLQFNSEETRDNFSGRFVLNNPNLEGQYSFFGQREIFGAYHYTNYPNISGYCPVEQNGPILNYEFQQYAISDGYCNIEDKKITFEHDGPVNQNYTGPNNQKFIVTSRDGFVITYISDGFIGLSSEGRISKMASPTGEIWNVYYVPSGTYKDEISAIVSNYGYMLKYQYYSDHTSIQAINRSSEYCDPLAPSCSVSSKWRSWTVGTQYAWFATPLPSPAGSYPIQQVMEEDAVDPTGNLYKLALNKIQYPSGRTISINYPQGTVWYEDYFHTAPSSGLGYSYDDFYTGPQDRAGTPPPNGVCENFDFKLCINGTFTASRSGATTTYNFESRAWSYMENNVPIYAPGYTDDGTMTVTNPSGSTKVIKSHFIQSNSYLFGRGMYYYKDELNRVTSFEYNQWFGKVSKIIYPEGNYTTMSYDYRGNLVERRDVAKSGTGLADIVWSASYPSSCASSVTCNKPTWSKDPKGNQTDYTYDSATGTLLKETRPADANGVRSETRYGYTPLYAKVLSSTGSLVNAEGPIWKLTCTVTVPSTTSYDPAHPCAAAAQYQITTYEYNSNNLLLTAETAMSGNADTSQAASGTNLWVRTSYGYDDYGNRIWIDGPRTDVDDRSYTTYDVLRRPILEIGVDPDGTGSLKRVVVKHTYDVDGNETLTQTGTGSVITFDAYGAPNGVSDFFVASFKRNTYDATTGLLAKTEVGQP